MAKKSSGILTTFKRVFKKEGKMVIKCPSCHTFLDDEDVGIGEIVYCSNCDKDFEVVQTKPLRLRAVASWVSDDEESLDEDYFG